MEFGFCFTSPDTPSLPLLPNPTGQLGDAPAPTLLFQSGLTLERKSVQTKLVPLPSERCTTVISLSGRFTPGLSFFSAASFHFLMVPRKMPASVSPVNLSVAVTPSILYVGTTPPSTVGKCRILALV